MKKIVRPTIYVGEWVLFLYVFLFISIFNMAYYANILLIDMPWEEPINLPFLESLLFILGIGVVCFLYIKYLIGNTLYKKIKEVIWGFLFGANLLSCVLWLCLSFPFGLSNTEQILVTITIVVSASLTFQVIKKYRVENRE